MGGAYSVNVARGQRADNAAMHNAQDVGLCHAVLTGLNRHHHAYFHTHLLITLQAGYAHVAIGIDDVMAQQQ